MRQAIFDLGWNLMMDDATDDPIGFHLAQLLDQHLLRNRRDRTFQVREAEHVAAEEMKQNHQLPTTLQNFEGIFNTLRRRARSQISALTVG